MSNGQLNEIAEKLDPWFHYPSVDYCVDDAAIENAIEEAGVEGIDESLPPRNKTIMFILKRQQPTP